MSFKSFFLALCLGTAAIAAPLEASSSVVQKRELEIPLVLPDDSPLFTQATHVGIATFYDQQGGFGSCGAKHPDSDKIIALSNYWQKKKSPGPYCGRKIQITNRGGGQNNKGKGNVVVATVADTCPGCDENHLDLSQGAFKALTGGSLDPPGQFNIEWHFCNTNGQC